MDKNTIINELKKKSEIVPDKHDGSYELMREIVRSYAALHDFSSCGYSDLDAVYAMALGTWKLNTEKKKDRIKETCLPGNEKERLVSVADKVWDKACKKEYENREDQNKPTVGMFGSGFLTFEKESSQIDCPAFIQMLTKIIDLEKDEEIYDEAEKVLSRPSKGMGAGAASVILHCLKPHTFPIFNRNMGHANIFELMGIPIEKPAELRTYIPNCRKIKFFRDSNFSFKNYRVFDIAAWDIPTEEGDVTEVKEMNKVSFDKNIILYGPPGIGKTYNTMAYSVAIIEGKSIDDIQAEMLDDYNSVKKRYEEYGGNGQIAFTTFHQSYGYEEFIEGIRPVLDSDKDDVSYSIESGIFKRFCENARPTIDAPDIEINKDAMVWYMKIYPDKRSAQEILDFCIGDGTIRMNWTKEEYESDSHEFLHWFKYDIEPGDYVVVSLGKSIISAIGVFEEGEAFWDEKAECHHAARKVEWLASGIAVDLKKYNDGISHPRFVISRLKNCTPSSVHKMLIDSGIYKEQKNDKQYVFIIDEINRGNISKILGELITLIEDCKREGEDEAITATLPYSNAAFSVPNNVYIIGTMNTADRSIALMDTALRRRFSFIEMMPEAEVLRKIGADKVNVNSTTIDVAKMLEIINRRVEYLYDREHTIGHAFFTGLKDDPTIEKLASIFEKAIIPLLQEYFYEDYSKIQLVLGDNNKIGDNKQYQLIRDEALDENEIFDGTTDIGMDNIRYFIQKSALKKAESYKMIGKGI